MSTSIKSMNLNHSIKHCLYNRGFHHLATSHMGHELWNPRSPGSPEWDETAAGGETRLKYKIKQSVKDNHNSWGKNSVCNKNVQDY